MNETQLFATYSTSHQNPTNQLIHYVCVPIIFFSIVAVIYATVPLWLTLLMLGSTLIFYYQSLRSFFPLMILVYAVTLGLCAIFAPMPYFIHVNVALFVLAWIGQFWGHKIEGKKPSFFQDILFLLVGPAWILSKWKAKLFSP